MQDNNQQSQPLNQPPPPSNLINNRKVIQPVSDMTEYVKQDTSQPSLRQAVESAPNSGALRPPADPPKIYPDIAPNTAPPNTTPNVTQGEVKSVNTQRVVSRVPAVRVYAFLTIIYSAYSLITVSSLFHHSQVITGRSNAGMYSLVTPLQLMVLGILAVNLAVGIYLLVAKNINMVNALLTALLIIGGINLLYALVGAVQFISYVNIRTIVSLFISAGLLMYLWNIKSQVDLASIE